MGNFIAIAFGVLLVVSGAVVAPLPIPFGIPMMIIGITILIARSPLAARLFTSLRRRWARFDGWIEVLEMHAPAVLAEVLRRTRPDV